MFFVVSKILAFLATPLIWFFIFMLIGIFWKKGKYFKKVAIGSFIYLYLITNTFLVDEFVRWWEVPPIQDSEIAPHSTAIILGGFSVYDEQLDRIQFYRSNDRLMQAIRLYQEGKVDKVIMTGGSASLVHPHLKEGIFIREFLEDLGLCSEDFYFEVDSKNTYENALFTKALIEDWNISGPYLLVTSGFHQRRGIACFEKQGISVQPYSVDRNVGDRKFYIDHLFSPRAGAINRWDMLWHEWLGWISYKMKGYI